MYLSCVYLHVFFASVCVYLCISFVYVSDVDVCACSCYLFEEGVLVVPDGNVLVLCGIGDDLNQAADLRLGVKRHAEQLCKTHTNKQS